MHAGRGAFGVQRTSRRTAILIGVLVVMLTALAPSTTSQARDNGRISTDPRVPSGFDKIQHIIIIMQENRSFDHYFGTYTSPSGEPVDGLPRKPSGAFDVCIPDPVLGHCVKPFHSTNLLNNGGPHSLESAVTAINQGRMNGYVNAVLQGQGSGGNLCATKPFSKPCKDFVGPQHQPDVMSFHNRDEIPNYWALADNYVLQDHMYEPVDSWSVPSHLYLVSGWSARCKDKTDPMSCVSDPRFPAYAPVGQPGGPTPYAWTDITWLLNQTGITWGYYVGNGTCLEASCAKDKTPVDGTTEGWNPLLGFTDIQEVDQYGGIFRQSDFDAAVANDTLPQVSWVIPGGNASEHPGHGSLRPGTEHVTAVLNEIGANPNIWNSSAIFLSWDDWGGFYDHEQPIRIDKNGYGIRTPGLMISPYAKEAFVDHQTLSFDAYLKFIEDRFLGGARLDPETDGRPDSRPTVREDVKRLGDAFDEFDFSQEPRAWSPLPP